MPRTAAACAATFAAVLALPACAQDDAERGPTAEELIETARELYAAREPQPDPCPEATGSEIVVCRRLEDPEGFRVPSSTDEAIANGTRPRDRIPQAPDVFGLPPCSSYQFCTKVGRTPPPIYIIDLAAIPEPLTPEEAAGVVRAEDLATRAAASPAAAP